MAKYAKRLDPESTSRIIDALRGTRAVARLIGCTPGAVSQWRRIGMPRARLMYLRERYRDLAIMHEPQVRRL